MRMTYRNDFVARCTPEEAFDFLSDLRNELEWNPDMCQSVEKISHGPVALGTKFRAKWKGGPMVEVEITHYDRPRTWRAHNGGALESNFQATVEAHPEGTKVVSELELIPHGFFKLLFPIFKMIFNKEAKSAVERMQNTLNARHASAKAA